MLRNKAILICSPQKWGDIWLSKHHYAIELARRGNRVYFLESPRRKVSLGIQLTPNRIEGISSPITIISYSSLVPYWVKFHLPILFRLMVFIQVQRVKRKLKEELFIVWDFENNCLYPNLNWFGAEYSIFHPVDKPHGKCPQKNEDFIFSVSEKILAFFPDSFQKKFINHGLSPLYEKLAKVPPRSIAYTGTIRVGYVGNLLFSNIDFEAFQFVVESFPEIAFHLIGPYFDSPANNLSGSYKTEAIILDFIQFLKNQRNVTLYGLKTPVEVANLISEFDILFICYKQNQNYLQDNSHKVLEYLSTGKLIIASPLSAYQNLEKDLILFAPQGDNLVLSDLMRMATSKLSHFNSIEKQQKRKQIALSNTYRSHVDEIEKLLQQKQKNEK